MSGSCVRARLLLLASIVAALLLVPLATASPAAGKKVLKPSDRVKTIKGEKLRPGPKQPTGTVVPLYGFNGSSAGAGTAEAGKSRSSLGSSALTADLPGSGPPTLLNKPGLTFDDGGFTPPDPTGAIGPNHYVEMVNSAIGVYDRDNLNLISKARLDTQFTNGGFFIDPQIQWDEQAQRWLYAAIGPQTQGATFSLLFGWSKTTDPSDVNPNDGTSGWCQYVLEPPPDSQGLIQLDDYPKLGHSDNHIIIGTNVFRGSLQIFFAGSRIWTIPKPTPGVTTCPSAPVASSFGYPNPLFTADGHQAFTPVPANTLDTTDKGYIVAADNPGSGSTSSQIMAWHVEGPSNSPVLVQDGNMDVSPYAQPQAPPQPGTADKLDMPRVGARLTGAVMDADPDAGGAKAVWTQHTVDGAGGRSEARWYELLPATRTVRQAGTVASALHYVFNAAISPTKRGNEAAINYNISSSSQAPQIAARSRSSNTPLSEMSGETIIATSPAALICGNNGSICRWGDYAGASPDPKNVHSIWGSNELAGPPTSNSNWTTQNFAVSTRRGRLATIESGAIVSALDGFDSAVGYFEVKGASDSPGPYEGSKFLRAMHWPQYGPAVGRFSEALPNGSDVWYGAAFYIGREVKSAADYIALLEWRDPVSDVHGGVSLRTDEQYHVVRGNNASPAGDTNVGPAFSLPEDRYIWLEVHQRLETANPLTEVFLDGNLISTSAAQNSYPDSLGIPSRVSYGLGTVSTNVFQLYFDRASLDVRQVGAVGAPATPTGFTGSGQDQTTVMYWNPVPGATGYRVYKQAADGTWTGRFDVATTAVFEPGLTNCTTYRYRVAAYSSATGLESVVSEPLALTPKAPGQQC